MRAAVGPIRRNAVARCDGRSEHERHRPEPAQGRRLIATALQADLYFADPDSAWQRGSNENANGLNARTCHGTPTSAPSPKSACDGSSNASTTDHARDSDSERPSKISERNSATALQIRVESTLRRPADPAGSRPFPGCLRAATFQLSSSGMRFSIAHQLPQCARFDNT